MEVEMKNEDEEMKSVCSGKEGVVRWERFIPRMTVRVLLVESDDSTRHIISALLRKCHYKVAAVADGLRAWEVLKERSSNIDLILTEVDLPSINGFALLTLITEDDVCRNIPVIMMSSHDSIGTVHKCMMRGASDFLMKPIRINELKNLWQHVWRKQSQTMAYGLSPQLESAVQVQMEVDEATAENNALSDRSTASKPLLLKEDECFKKQIDAESSCTNPSLEVRSAYVEQESQGLSGTNKLTPQDNANIVADEDLYEGEHTMTQGGTLAESSREAIDLIGAFDNKGRYNGSWLNNEPNILESSGPNLCWSGFQLNGLQSNTNCNKVLVHSNASAFSRYINKESQVMPRESTMNSVEHYSIHVHTNYSETNYGSSYNRSAISLPVNRRGEHQVAFAYDQHRLYPIPFGTRDVNYLQHFTSDCGKQEVEKVDKKTPLSPPTDPSGSDSFGNGGVSHTDTGNADERSIPPPCSNQREVALMKFRLKRKERCYEKKVRYESRKKLADQRPHVKGQFVRRIPPDPPPPNQEADYASVLEAN